MNIIITGAGRGIGFETAKLFSKMKGNRIIAVSRNITALQKISETIPRGKNNSSLYPFAVDLSKNEFEKDILKYVLDRFNKIDILINNAGILVNKTLQNLSEKDYDNIFNVNIKAPFLLTKALLPHFNNPSHIVNISSMGGFLGSVKFPGLSLYSASKGALAVFSECLAEEFKDQGISVNCLSLGSVQTEMLNEAFPNYKASQKPLDIAEFIVDFAINGNKYMNGKIIPVSLSTP
ncbi:MAG: SDR family oxidoreductase [Bacteroidetes bacterium]|nr:SDR family oxidoreductase [Bacteroidota bacterium]